MSVLVARFAGAGEDDKVDRTVYQAFLTAIGMSVLIMAPIGYFAVAVPARLRQRRAGGEGGGAAVPAHHVPVQQRHAVFFMLGGALRSAGDARTPMVLGIAMTVLNVVFNIILIRGLGRSRRSAPRARRWARRSPPALMALYALYKLWRGGWVVSLPARRTASRPDWTIIRSLFRFGLPTGIQGIAMNVGGVLHARRSSARWRRVRRRRPHSPSRYTQLFSLITWTSVGLMGAAAAIAGQNLGAGNPDRAEEAVHVAARLGLAVAAFVGALFFFFPAQLLAVFGMTDPAVVDDRQPAAARAQRVGSVHHRRPDVHRRTAGHRRHQEPACTSPSFRRSSFRSGSASRSSRLGDAAAAPHLARDSRRPRDALFAQRAAVQSGQVARHRGRYRPRLSDRAHR